MTDAPFYAPGRVPPSRVLRPGEPLWEDRKDHRTYSCELRYHGEYGVEAQILRDGDLLVGHILPTKALAVQWADEMRKLIGERRWA